MKKLVIATFMLLFSISLFADIDVGEFTWGEWLDPNYNAIWSIRNSNVRILDLEGGCITILMARPSETSVLPQLPKAWLSASLLTKLRKLIP
jgi:hypothetical protein